MSPVCLAVLATLTLDAAPPSPPLDFNLRDPASRTHRLADWSDRPVVVVVFLGVDCPLAKLYAPRLIELSKRHPRRTAFAAVFPNQHDTVRDVARYAREHAVPFPALRDVGNVVADRFDARRSPEVFVLDQARRVRYRGRIDDQYSVGIHRPRATSHELADAVESLLAGKPVRVVETTPPGCPISRVKKNTVRDHSVTYCRDVAPILARRCVACHRPGQSAPFALTSHAAASGWAGAIREVIEERRMPPWGADPAHGTFANDPSLTPAEKDTLFRWIDAGCPEGDRRHLPPPPTFPEGWTIPRPDLVLSMPVEFEVPAEGVIEYQHFRVDPGFKEDRWVTAAEIMPGNRSVVHHCNIFLQPPGIDDPEYLAEAGKLGSYCLTMIAQGTPPMRLPPGMAKRIPAGWRIVFVMHYQAVGSRQKDRTRLALTFADPRTVRQEVATKLIFDLNLRIPPGASDHRVTHTWAVNQDVHLLSFSPHLHLRGRSFRYDLVHPDGREEILLDVPRFDFAWQHSYVLAAPRRIAAGSQVRCTAVYDNSADNPANPDPSVEVRTGTQSWDEMFNGYFDVALADEDLTRPPSWRDRVGSAVALVGRPGVALVVCLAGGLFLLRRRLANAP